MESKRARPKDQHEPFAKEKLFYLLIVEMVNNDFSHIDCKGWVTHDVCFL